MYSGWVTGGAHYLILTPYRTHLPSVSSVCCDLSGIVLFCLYFLKGKRIKWKLKPVSWTTLPYFQLLNLYFSRRDSLNIKFLLSGFLFFVFNFTPSSFHDCSVRKLVLFCSHGAAVTSTKGSSLSLAFSSFPGACCGMGVCVHSGGC